MRKWERTLGSINSGIRVGCPEKVALRGQKYSLQDSYWRTLGRQLLGHKGARLRQVYWTVQRNRARIRAREDRVELCPLRGRPRYAPLEIRVHGVTCTNPHRTGAFGVPSQKERRKLSKPSAANPGISSLLPSSSWVQASLPKLRMILRTPRG